MKNKKISLVAKGVTEQKKLKQCLPTKSVQATEIISQKVLTYSNFTWNKC